MVRRPALPPPHTVMVFAYGSMPLTLPSKKRVFLQMVRMGVTMCLVSIIPDTTWGSMGVKSRKLSSFIMTRSMSGSSPSSDSSWRAHATPAKPPPPITILFLVLAAPRLSSPIPPPLSDTKQRPASAVTIYAV